MYTLLDLLPADQLIAQGGLGVVVLVLVGLFVWTHKESRGERREDRERAERQHAAMIDVVARNAAAISDSAAATREQGEAIRDLRGALLEERPRRIRAGAL